jgi:hypothetical protein
MKGARVSFELAFENRVISCFKRFLKVFDRLKPRLGFFRQILVQTENDVSLIAHSGLAHRGYVKASSVL